MTRHVFGKGPAASEPRRAVAPRLRLAALLFLAVLAPLILFGALADEVWEEGGFGWDATALRVARRIASGPLDDLMLGLSDLGGLYGTVAAVAIVLAVLIRRGRRADAVFFAAAISGAMLLNLVAKLAFHRARPRLWEPLEPAAGYSFPSGHAMSSMAIAAAIVVLTWATRGRWPVIAAAVALVTGIGLSRVYLGVHFPSDVLAGWSAALAWVAGLALLTSGRRDRASTGVGRWR